MTQKYRKSQKEIYLKYLISYDKWDNIQEMFMMLFLLLLWYLEYQAGFWIILILYILSSLSSDRLKKLKEGAGIK